MNEASVKTYAEAKELCEEAGMSLPVLDTVTKQKVWTRMSMENTFMPSTRNFWLGMLREQHTVFAWTDGSPIDDRIVPSFSSSSSCMKWRDSNMMNSPCSNINKIMCEGKCYLYFIFIFS